MYNKQKLLRMYIFLKIASIAKNSSSENDQYHVPVHSRTIGDLSVVT